MPLEIIIPLLIGLLAGAFIVCVLNSFLSSRRGKIQSAAFKFSEKDVESLLRKSGFRILGRHLRETVITNIDGKDHFGFVEADYTVSKGRKKYVVLVKTGEGLSDPNDPVVRRKLLELNRVFFLDGVLLVDPGQGEVHTVNFRFPHERNIDFFFRFLIGVFIILVVVGIIWMMVTLKLF